MSKRKKYKRPRIFSRILSSTKSFTATAFRQNIPGVIIGLAVSATLSLLIWAFAYFGFIDLGLPQRFEFEKLDHAIRSQIPKHYNYTTEKIHFRDSQNETLVVIARDKDAYSIEQKTDSDIILLLDKTDKEYKVTYKFQPTKPEYGPLHAVFFEYQDVGDDQRADIVIGWSYIGASYSPPMVVAVTAGEGSGVVASGVPRLSNYTYPEGYKDEILVNRYDQTTIPTQNFYFFRVRDGEIVTVKRDDDACNACGEEHVYNINFFRLSDGKLQEWGSPQTGIKGYPGLKEILKERGYEMDI